MFIYVKRAKCPNCQKEQIFCGEYGLRVRCTPDTNYYNLLLSCSVDCARKFSCKESYVQDAVMTHKGPIPYRKITQTS